MSKIRLGSMGLGLVTLLLFLSSCGGGNTASTVTVTGLAATGTARGGRAIIGEGYVGLLVPVSSQLTNQLFQYDSGAANRVTTGTDGKFTFVIEKSALSSGKPYFLAVSDSAGTYTRLATLPADKVAAGAPFAVDIDDTTTGVAHMQCPGGKYPAPTGAYCYSDPKESTSTTLEQAADAAQAADPSIASQPPNWKQFVKLLLDNTTMMDALKAALAQVGVDTSGLTSTNISNRIITAVPKIPKPTFMDKNDGSCGSEGSPSCSSGLCISTRSCVKSSLSGNCDCAGSILGECSDVSSCGGIGDSCGSGTPCCRGKSCVNGTCDYSVNTGDCPVSI